MSVTNSKRIAKTRSKVDYELYGAKGSETYKRNKAEGPDRVAAMRIDAESPEMFVDRAEAMAKAHGRKIEARSLIQSFERDEFDPTDPPSVQAVNDLGYKFAKSLHPHSDVLVITHVDGAGGHPHNHITVINHDNVTSKALQANNMHWHVSKQNDALMLEHDLRVAERGSRNVDQRALWEHKREGESVSEFDRELGDQITDALADRRSIDLDNYRGVLAEKGIQLHEKVDVIRASNDYTAQKRQAFGWTYKAVDETGTKPRKRRRKASSLSDEFTHDGAQEIFNYNKERTVRHERQGHDRTAGTRPVVLGDVRISKGDAQRTGGDPARDRADDRVTEQPHIDDGGGFDVDGLRRSLEHKRRADEARRGDEEAHAAGGRRRGSRGKPEEQRSRAARRRKLLEEVRRGGTHLDQENHGRDVGPSF